MNRTNLSEFAKDMSWKLILLYKILDQIEKKKNQRYTVEIVLGNGKILDEYYKGSPHPTQNKFKDFYARF